jgi:hypothetical protein
MRRLFALVLVVLILAVAYGCSKRSGPGTVSVRPAPGTFELCVLANPEDDADAIQQATEFFAAARTDPKLAATLRQRNEANEPPPPPMTGDGPEFVVFNEVYTYRWAPVSSTILQNQALEPAPAPGSLGARLYDELKEARAQGRPHHAERLTDAGRVTEIWWSREQPPRNGWPGGIDYFLLVREEPKDQAIQADEIHMTWNPADAVEGFQIVAGTLNSSGTQKLASLTTRNRPTEIRPGISMLRSLAILIHGKVVTDPTINEPITTGRFVFRGKYTDQEMANLLGEVGGD